MQFKNTIKAILLLFVFNACHKTVLVDITSDFTQSPNIVIAPPNICPNGGVIINNIPICNGINAGFNYVRAAKLCPNDDNILAEYGFIIGKDLYVMWNNISINPPVNNAGLIKLWPGWYATTTYTPYRIFLYEKTNTEITLSCDNVFNVYSIDDEHPELDHVACELQLTNNLNDPIRVYQFKLKSPNGLIYHLQNDYEMTFVLTSPFTNYNNSCTGFNLWIDNVCDLQYYDFTASASNDTVIYGPPYSNNIAPTNITYPIYLAVSNSQHMIKKAIFKQISTGKTKTCSIIHKQ